MSVSKDLVVLREKMLRETEMDLQDGLAGRRMFERSAAPTAAERVAASGVARYRLRAGAGLAVSVFMVVAPRLLTQ